MTITEKVKEFITALLQSTSDQTFVSLTLGNYKGQEENLKNIYVKRILLKKQEKFSFTYRYKTRDIVKNFDPEAALETIEQQLRSGFHFASLFTISFDLKFEMLNNDKAILKKSAPTSKITPTLDHDKNKNRLIGSKGKSYLTDLKITDKEGNVFKNAQDKYKQINHYIEILSSLFKEIPVDKTLKLQIWAPARVISPLRCMIISKMSFILTQK